jgi:hypothetical protein
MSPYQHGEVFVTDDGAETDLDLGHYERFTGVRQQGRQHHHRPHLSGHHRQGAARRLSRRHRAGDPARHRRHQGIHPRRATTATTSCWSRSAARSATSRACRSSRRSASSATNCRAATPHLHPPDADALHPLGRRAEDQADPALGEGAALDRHPARHPAVPLRPADPGERAAQDRAVLQRAPESA